ncbi:unnamed protein product, partial [Durusdinium trenchii]
SSHERTFQDLHLCLAMAMALARGPQGPRGPLHLPSHPVLARTPCRRTGAAGLHCFATAAVAVAVQHSRRDRKYRRIAVRAESSRTVEKETPWLEIAGAVAVALLDIFKGPPEESTDATAPGLKEIGKPVAEALASCSLQDIRSGETVEASKLLTTRSGIFFLTHWGDFNSWEVAQQVRTAIQAKRLDASSICLVGIGSQSSGAKFAEMLELPADVKIYTDARASCYSALCFSRGALPQYSEQLNPYLRVFLMLLGVGSPGTIRTVLGGYIGDRSRPNSATAWIDDALRQGAKKGRWPTAVPDLLGDWKMLELAEVGNGVWDEGFGQEGLRPFELATIRLQNMVGGIIANWSDLAPEDDELLVQQGLLLT